MNSQKTRDLNELKKQALNFYSLNGDIPKKIEDALNSLFYDSPYDVYGYLSEYFGKYQKPSFLTKIVANKSVYYDSKGQQTFLIDVYCQDKNKEIKTLSLFAPCYSPDIINDASKIQHIQEDDAHRSTRFNTTIHFINNDINDLIKNYNPHDQEELDARLHKLFQVKQSQTYQSFITSLIPKDNASSIVEKEIDGKKSKTPTSPKQKTTKQDKAGRKTSQTCGTIIADEMTAHLNSTFYALYVESLISKAICLSSIAISKKQAFEHILELSSNHSNKYSMPTPMITLIQNGKGFHGKQYLVKEYILMPKPNVNLSEGIELVSKINRFIRDTLCQSKSQPGACNKSVTDNGSYSIALDTPQQGLDLIENAITSACSPDEVPLLSIALNMAAAEFYDAEKAKYEIASGNLKTSDELIEVYVDLVTKCSKISMIIEPFIKSEPLAWYKLYSRLSKHCLIANSMKINENLNPIPGEVSVEAEINGGEKFSNASSDQAKIAAAEPPKLPDSLKPTQLIIMPVNFFKFEHAATVTSLIQNIKETKKKNNEDLYVGLSCGFNESEDAFISDLSVGNQLSFIKIGGLNRMERINKINRLIEIESYLKDNGVLVDAKEKHAEFNLITNLDIPEEYLDHVKVYLNAIEESKIKASHKK